MNSVTYPVIHQFQVLRPEFEGRQENFFKWLPKAHARASNLQDPDQSSEKLIERFEKILRRVGCGPDRIETRGHELSDFNHENWTDMEVFRMENDPAGQGTEFRMRAYSKYAGGALEKLYARELQAPSDLIHVSCTGYVSPSPSQRLIGSKNWGDQTTNTHAYHMGCYAAFPALRLARGFLSVNGAKKRVDIVHTEICSLHFNPADHSLENFVVQTLFADGFIRYSMSQELPPSSAVGYEILGIHEAILPGTEDAMTWICGDHGMKMTLSKDVPSIVGEALPSFIASLLQPLHLSFHDIKAEARFAIHPGGPKILDHIQEALALRPAQIEASREILRTHGNMSSATLPHIWEKIANDESVNSGSLVLSFAFGPGLTVCGAVLRKIRA